MKINKYNTKTGEFIESIEFVDGDKVRYELETVEDKYNELLHAVENKYTTLTRHEAVLFLIKKSQNQGSYSSKEI